MQDLVDAQETLLSSAAPLGVGWLDQCRPSHRYTPLPTAVHASRDVHETPSNVEPPVSPGPLEHRMSGCRRSDHLRFVQDPRTGTL